MKTESQPLLSSRAGTNSFAEISPTVAGRSFGWNNNNNTSFNSTTGGVASNAPPASLPTRATAVWFAELQQVEDEGDREFGRRRKPLFERARKPHVFSPDERKRMDGYESIDYFEPQSLIFKDHLGVVRTERRWLKWVVYVAVGAAVGLWACLLFQTLDCLADLKTQLLETVVRNKFQDLKNSHDEGMLTAGGVPRMALMYGYATYLIWAVVAALVSPLCCLMMPSAAGSGVPDVMAYLNGVMFPRIFNIRNLVVKTVSCIAAVASGLPVGAEGPMIHIGALIGAGLPTGRSRSLKCSATSLLSMFRNTKDHRDFISAGAACGVTTAFSSPIGGLLFVMEEVATFFPVKLAWTVFMSCLSAMFTMQLLNTYLHGWQYAGDDAPPDGNFADRAITMFRVHIDGIPSVPMSLLTFVPATLIGLVMGLLSVAFVLGSVRVSRFRAKYITPRPMLRVMEPALLVTVYATLSYLLPILFDCEPIPDFVKRTPQLDIHLSSSYCADSDNFYQPLATLTITNSYNVIRVLFSRHTQGLLPWHSLVIFQALYTIGAMYAGGMFISAGIVIPTLVMGAIGGRLMGVMFGDKAWADPGVMALIGAASYFGGLARLTFSLVVIMMELTNDLSHMPCLMLGIIVAKTLSDKFCHSLYHAMLEVKSVPFLSVEDSMHRHDTFSAKDIMTAPVVVLKTVDRVQNVVDVLQGTSHHAFPVVSVGNEKTYRGMVQRRQLELLMWFIYFRDTEASASYGYASAHSKPHASYEELKEVQERIFWERLPPLPPVNQLPVETQNSYLDLNPYVDLSAYHVRDVMCISRTYSIFQNMGLRHLPVVNRHNHVVGILTRKNFVGDRMYERIEEADVKAKEAARRDRRKRRQREDAASNSAGTHSRSNSKRE